VRVIINGGSGWLGHATLGAIFEKYSEVEKSDLQVISSKARRIESSEFGTLMSIGLNEAKKELEQTDIFIQLAFKTRDHIKILGEVKYENLNSEIIENTVDAIRKSNPKNVVMVSSGVVSQWLNDQASFKKDSYVKMKLMEEAEIGKLCSDLGINLVNLRLWGASGEHMTEPLKYAIGDLIHQDITSKSLKVNSAHLVYRRYADASQQMLICMRAAISGINETLESGGFIVEIGELAQRVIELSGSRKQIIRPEINTTLTPDEYFSTSRRMEELAESFGIRLMGLDDQILSTKNAVSRLILS
jgi:nucleoside-diphosphate-sugar epimerase